MSSQHWYDKNKGQPQKAFNSAAHGATKPLGHGSDMVKNSKPYPELRPKNEAARIVKAQTHNQQLQKESKDAQQRNEAIRKATLERLRSKQNSREQGRER